MGLTLPTHPGAARATPAQSRARPTDRPESGLNRRAHCCCARCARPPVSASAKGLGSGVALPPIPQSATATHSGAVRVAATWSVSQCGRGHRQDRAVAAGIAQRDAASFRRRSAGCLAHAKDMRGSPRRTRVAHRVGHAWLTAGTSRRRRSSTKSSKTTPRSSHSCGRHPTDTAQLCEPAHAHAGPKSRSSALDPDSESRAVWCSCHAAASERASMHGRASPSLRFWCRSCCGA